MRVWVAMQTCCRWRYEDVIPNAGWHLSYFGDARFIRNKLEHFGHQEYNSEEYTNENHINNAIREGTDLFNRDNITITKIKIGDNPLPPRLDLLSNYLGSLPTR
jgi:beta-1,4-mannosyl-glycoprotein beta-1,4-N-acetylglucosaminyltransferase